MSKEYGHTKTLFLQNGKYYKWSYKFEHCIKCGTCNHKHKGRGLCTSCWDKERDNNKNRIETKRKAGLKWHKENYKPVEVRKVREKTFDREKYIKEWYLKNQEALSLKAKSYRMRKKGIKCLEIMINGETKYLPFIELLKQPSVREIKKYEEWRKQQRQFNILRKYYIGAKN